jgi:hypothetical protein
MSAASFQETTKVLNEAAINGKSDKLEGEVQIFGAQIRLVSMRQENLPT